MKRLCVQGLGFVGIAMATATADVLNGDGAPLYDVVGVELDNERGRERVNTFNSGIFPLECEDDSLKTAFSEAIKRGNLCASTDPGVYAEAEIVVVDVNLDLVEQNGTHTVSWDIFKGAIATLGARIGQDTLVLVETTVPPGTCERVALPLLKEAFARRGLDAERVLLAHSYERVMPGKHYLDSVKNYWRVYAGCSPEAAQRCEAFLNTVINTREYPLTQLPSPRASETAKVMENSYRAANIAFIEEWSAFADKAGIDLFEVIEAIRMRPTHSNMMRPGLGVGGYCLTKDPLFAGIAGHELFGVDADFPFCEMAVRVNNAMPYSSVKMLKGLIGGLSGKRVLIMGVSYRQDVGDTRYSPSETLARALISEGVLPDFHDPFVDYWAEMDVRPHKGIPDLGGYDAIILAVAHTAYGDIDMGEWLKGCNACILDTNNVLSAGQRAVIKALPNAFASVGRGGI